MTHIDEKGNVWIAEEPPGKCSECGRIKETRPYGKGGREVCIECAKKDPEETERQMNARFNGISPPPPLRSEHDLPA